MKLTCPAASREDILKITLTFTTQSVKWAQDLAVEPHHLASICNLVWTYQRPDASRQQEDSLDAESLLCLQLGILFNVVQRIDLSSRAIIVKAGTLQVDRFLRAERKADMSSSIVADLL